MTVTGRPRAASRCFGATGTAYRNSPRLTPPAPPPSASPATRGSFGSADGQAQRTEGESTSDSPDTSGPERPQLHSHTRYAEHVRRGWRDADIGGVSGREAECDPPGQARCLTPLRTVTQSRSN